jgi:hypothetical protein
LRSACRDWTTGSPDVGESSFFPFRGVDRRRHERGLEVVERELRRRADDRRRLVHVVHRRQLDVDLVRPLLRHDRLRDAELVDALADDLDRAVHVVRRQRLALGRLSLEDDLDAALKVESLAEGPVDRRARQRERDDAAERGEDEDDEREVGAPRRQTGTG